MFKRNEKHDLPVMSDDVKVMVGLVLVWVVPSHLIVEDLMHLVDELRIAFRGPLEDGARAAVPRQDVEDQLGLNNKSRNGSFVAKH